MSEREKKLPVTNSIPPPSNGYWGWVREALQSKADEKWVESEIHGLRRAFDDTKSTATEAKRTAELPYACKQEKEIEKMRSWQERATNWKIPVVISIVVLVVGAAGQYFSLKDAVEDGNQDRELVQQTLKKIEAKQAQTSKVVEDLKRQEHEKEEQRRSELRELLREVVHEKPTNRRTTSRRGQ